MKPIYARLVVRPDESTPGNGLIIGYSKGLFKPGVLYQAEKPYLDTAAAYVHEVGPHPFSLPVRECYDMLGVSYANEIGHLLTCGGNRLWLSINELKELSTRSLTD